MTQGQLAEELGVSKRSIGSWERGETIPRNRVAALADVLGLEGMSEFGTKALMRQLGQLAKQRREELGMARVALAKEMGLGSDKTLVTFEFGRGPLSGTSYRRIEKGLGWRLGVIDDVLRMTNRKASEITMEDVDAEDSLHIAAQGGIGLALVSNEDLIAELSRRLWKSPGPMQNEDAQNLYGLAASTNQEHLEDDDDTGE